MKSWYIVLQDTEQECRFLSIVPAMNLLFLSYKEITVKIRIPSFKTEYYAAKNGELTVAFAVGPKRRNTGKPIKIIFK